jgi:outer membrane lipoprotein SlyB
MVLDVQSITVDGRRYLVSTTDLTRESETGIGKNTRTAEAIGGGAALGTIIGAIAGGGKGAAIGVLIGAAGGAGAQVLTRGRDVQVPAETILKFRLDKPVTLQPER